MKTLNSIGNISALTAAISLLALTASAVETPSTTIVTNSGKLEGEISSNSQMIQVGQRPTIKWNIVYPSSLTEFFPGGGGGGGGGGGSVTPIKPVVADVKMLGQGVTSGLNFIRTQGLVSLGTSGFRKVFDGVNSDITTNNVALSSLFGSTYAGNVIPAGTEIKFGGRWQHPETKVWSKRYSSGDGTTNVRILVDGDTPPVGLGISDGPTLESFLRPYIDSAGKVNIGPMDMIVFLELTHSQAESSDSGYDFQDLLFVVTFKKPIP